MFFDLEVLDESDGIVNIFCMFFVEVIVMCRLEEKWKMKLKRVKRRSKFFVIRREVKKLEVVERILRISEVEEFYFVEEDFVEDENDIYIEVKVGEIVIGDNNNL